MTALEMTIPFRIEPVRYDMAGALAAGWRAFRRHREQRRFLIEISRLGPHVIRDIGFEPEEVYAALDGTWDEVDPESFGGRLPRRTRFR